MNDQEFRGMRSNVIAPRRGRIPPARVVPLSARVKAQKPPAEVINLDQKAPDPSRYLARREYRARRLKKRMGTGASGAKLTFLNID